MAYIFFTLDIILCWDRTFFDSYFQIDLVFLAYHKTSCTVYKNLLNVRGICHTYFFQPLYTTNIYYQIA